MAESLNWLQIFLSEEQEEYFYRLTVFLNLERLSLKTIYPTIENILNAFYYTPFANVKVVILGQDPYHGPNQADGLCFSVPDGVPIPPSLRNIYRELEADIPSCRRPRSGCLKHWAKQGVLLLNAVLTVEAKRAHSHAKIGWQQFTDHVLSALNQHREGVIFLLWGISAKKKSRIIDQNRHSILMAAHPSPFSSNQGFFGCRHFSRTNQLLADGGKDPINW